MKKLIGLVIILIISQIGFAQDSGEIAVPFSDPAKRGKLRVDLRKGSIEVIGTNRKDILVKYASRGSNKSDEESKNGLKRIASAALNLEITEKNNYVIVESESWNKAMDVRVEVPSNIDLHLETYNSGVIYLSNIQGEIVTDNYNGKITADKVSGSLVADTYNGSITVSFDKITPDTPMAFTTYNGNVDLTLPSNFKASLKMKTSRGEIYSGFDFATKKSDPITKTEKKSGTYKVYLDDWVRGDVNGGGPEFMLKNYNGDIYLRKK